MARRPRRPDHLQGAALTEAEQRAVKGAGSEAAEQVSLFTLDGLGVTADASVAAGEHRSPAVAIPAASFDEGPQDISSYLSQDEVPPSGNTGVLVPDFSVLEFYLAGGR